MLWLLGLTLLLGCVDAKVDYTGHRLISIQAKNATQVQILRDLQDDLNFKLDFWTEPSLMRPTDVHVPPSSYRRLQRTLMKAGIHYEVRNENIQELIDMEARSMMGRSYMDIENSYLSYVEVIDYLYYMDANYDTISLTDIGSSHEGRYLMEVKVAEDPYKSKPIIYMECLTHAREWLSLSTCLNLIDTLANDESMLVNYDWHIVPLHNPDGYEYSRTNDRMWRKNREEPPPCTGWFCWNSCYGTDLNRNWDANHGGEGSSGSTCSDTYHGGSAFSAPETNALQGRITALLDMGYDITAFISIHCYSQLLLTPYGHTSTRPSDYQEVDCVAYKMAGALEAVYGTKYEVGTPPALLYVASGGAYDWAKSKAGIKYSYTYELRPGRDNSGDGFVQPASQIYPTAIETIASLREFANMPLPCFA